MTFMTAVLRFISFIDQRINFIRRWPAKANVLDIGCGKGDVLRRFIKLRPDVDISAVDIDDYSQYLPVGIHFKKLDAASGRLPFEDNSFDGVTIVHVVEHLNDIKGLVAEIVRILRPGGALYIETPGLISTKLFKASDIFKSQDGGPLSFHDDLTHKRLWTFVDIKSVTNGMAVVDMKSGVYRNWLYTIISPLLIVFGYVLRKRRWFVVGIHHLIGWSMYFTASKRK